MSIAIELNGLWRNKFLQTSPSRKPPTFRQHNLESCRISKVDKKSETGLGIPILQVATIFVYLDFSEAEWCGWLSMAIISLERDLPVCDSMSYGGISPRNDFKESVYV